jgi:hypothetical protein
MGQLADAALPEVADEQLVADLVPLLGARHRRHRLERSGLPGGDFGHGRNELPPASPAQIRRPLPTTAAAPD